MANATEKAKTIARRIAPQFFAEGYKRVYVAVCCKRVLVLPEKVTKCRTCEGTPEGFWVTPDNLHTVAG